MPYMKNPSGQIVNVRKEMAQEIMKSIRPKKVKKIDPRTKEAVVVDQGWDVVGEKELKEFLAKEAEAVEAREKAIAAAAVKNAKNVVMIQAPADKVK